MAIDDRSGAGIGGVPAFDMPAARKISENNEKYKILLNEPLAPLVGKDLKVAGEHIHALKSGVEEMLKRPALNGEEKAILQHLFVRVLILKGFTPQDQARYIEQMERRHGISIPNKDVFVMSKMQFHLGSTPKNAKEYLESLPHVIESINPSAEDLHVVIRDLGVLQSMVQGRSPDQGDISRLFDSVRANLTERYEAKSAEKEMAERERGMLLEKPPLGPPPSLTPPTLRRADASAEGEKKAATAGAVVGAVGGGAGAAPVAGKDTSSERIKAVRLLDAAIAKAKDDPIVTSLKSRFDREFPFYCMRNTADSALDYVNGYLKPLAEKSKVGSPEFMAIMTIMQHAKTEAKKIPPPG